MIGSWESSGVATIRPLRKWYHTWSCHADWCTGIWHMLHQAYVCGTRPFLRLFWSQGRTPDTSGSPKNASGPVDKVKFSVQYQSRRCKDEIFGSHFGVSLEKEPHTRRKPVQMKPANKHAQSTTENQEENPRSVAALFLSSWYVGLFLQQTWSTQFTYSPE